MPIYSFTTINTPSMRRTTKFFLTTFLSFFLFAISAGAQSWMWGRGSTGGAAVLIEGYFCAVDGAGNVYGTGTYAGGTTLGSYFLPRDGQLLVKYDNNGGLKWVLSIDTVTIPTGLAADRFGNEYVMGSSATTFTFGGKTFTRPPGIMGTCYFIAKVDSSGNVLWVKSLGNVQGTLFTGAKLLTTDREGNILVTCSYSNSPTLGSTTLPLPVGADDILVAKLDSSGNAIWATHFGGRGAEITTGIAVTQSLDIYITGFFGSDTLPFGSHLVFDTGTVTSMFNKAFYLAKLDSMGSVQWAIANGGGSPDDKTTSVTADEQHVYIAGYYDNSTLTFATSTLPEPGYGTYGFLAQYNSSGTAAWGKSVAGLYISSPYYFAAIDECSNVWLAGGCGDSRVPDTIDGRVITYPPLSADPMFIAGWNTGGTLLQTTVLASGGDDILDIAVDPAGKLFIESDYAVDTLPVGTDTIFCGCTGAAEHNFMGCYNPNICSIPNEALLANHLQQPVAAFRLFPNPASSEIDIESADDIRSIAIISIAGKTVLTHKYDGARKQVPVDVAGLPGGMYFIKVNGIYAGKFVKD
jgi:type IX secretion system substrate protein